MPRATMPEPTIEVSTAKNASTEEAASADLARAAASTAPPVVEKPDPRLDGAGPGEVFARECLGCHTLKQTGDQTGKTKCRRCRVKAGEPYEGVALPPLPKAPPRGTQAPGIEVERADRVVLGEDTPRR